MRKKNSKMILGTVLIVLYTSVYLLFFNKTEYKRLTSKFTAVTVEKVEKMASNNEDFVLYLGRESCPACVDFVPILSKVSEKNNYTIYYIDTDSKASTLEEFRKKHNIKYVPSVLVVSKNDYKTIDIGKSTIETLQEQLQKILLQ